MVLADYMKGTYVINPSSTERGATPRKGFYRNSAESLIRKGDKTNDILLQVQ